MSFSRDKDVETFLKLVLATGKVSLAPGGKHVRLFWRDSGRPIIDRGFPVTVSTSPSAPSWRRSATDQLVRCGVFERTARGPRRKPYRVRPLAERVREIADPRADKQRVRAIVREVARLEAAA